MKTKSSSISESSHCINLDCLTFLVDGVFASTTILQVWFMLSTRRFLSIFLGYLNVYIAYASWMLYPIWLPLEKTTNAD